MTLNHSKSKQKKKNCCIHTVYSHKPITVDSEYRPLITVDDQMPGPTIIAREIKCYMHHCL